MLNSSVLHSTHRFNSENPGQLGSINIQLIVLTLKIRGEIARHQKKLDSVPCTKSQRTTHQNPAHLF